jgi:hydroxymethylpyrimidine pyrophosphatase-like HAD family hydrolase
MQYLALACDYDGTLAHHGQVGQQTIVALERVVASGRHLLLISGRLLEDLQRVFPHLDLFTYVVAENGALLYDPHSGKQTLLAEPPPTRFLQALRERGVTPLATGKVIVATQTPYDTTVTNVIHEMGLELQVIFNKGAVMVLPAGIDKSTGLQAAVQALQLSPQNVVGVGDAENDRSFLALCGYSVAVANALPALKELVDYTTQASDGNGVIELIERLLSNGLPRNHT